MAAVKLSQNDLQLLAREVAKELAGQLDLQAMAMAAATEALAQHKRSKKKVYTAREIAEIMGVTLQAVAYRRQMGDLKGTRRTGGGSRYYYPREEVAKMLGTDDF